ncbi:MAG: U32 family peptidase, partial [Bacteroidaceae bacterium]
PAIECIKEIELLSPARNVEIGIEAIKCGADTIYIGAPAFGARHAAVNSVDDIKRLVEYAHLYGAKVYVTLNTILYEHELFEAEKLAHSLIDIGVDAFITQDLAYKAMQLEIPLHASTQMDNRTIERIKQLESWGFEQAVLARELGLDEIKSIHDACPNMKLEAFIHGALCVSYSGRCYASQFCFNRSANRGQCAQFCRLAFDLEDGDGKVLVKNKYLLSLKDMNRSSHIEEMLDAGICSLKIEGRLKEIGYVKNVTAYYNAILNEIVNRRHQEFKRSSRGTCNISFQPDLSKTFNRGFTNYFLTPSGNSVCSIDTPKSIGEKIGVVERQTKDYILFKGNNRVNNGDGICFINYNGVLEGFRANNVVGNKIYPFPNNIKVNCHTWLYRNRNIDFEKKLQRPESKRTIDINIIMEENNEGFLFFASVPDGPSVTIEKKFVKEPARTSQIERISKELLKTGDTIFKVDTLEIRLSGNYFIPGSILSQWRREIMAEMLRAIKMKDKDVVAKNNECGGCVIPDNIDFTYNISNSLARKIYEDGGAKIIQPALEVSTTFPTEMSSVVIMMCKHCIRRALGACLKDKGRKISLPRSLQLSLPDGRKFPLSFDCEKCEMTVKAKIKS